MKLFIVYLLTDMDKKKLVRIIAVTVLVLAILFFLLRLASKNSAQKEIIPVPIGVARQVAETGLTAFEEWRGPTLDEWYTFYDLEEQPSAYLFNISDYYGKAGYVVVSATTKLEPIIDVSNSTMTPVTKTIELVNDMTIGTMYEPSDIKSEYIYLGGSEYYARLTLREGSDMTVKYYEILEGSAKEVNVNQVVEKQGLYEKYREEDAKGKWREFIEWLTAKERFVILSLAEWEC